MREVDLLINNVDRVFFQENGYWIGPKLFSDEQIDQLRKAHMRIWENDFDYDGEAWRKSQDPYALRKMGGARFINNDIYNAVTSKLIGEIASILMDTDEVRVWHDQVLFKPGIGQQEMIVGNVGWHQDYAYWRCTNTTNMVTAWIALQDTDVSNGCMLFVNGSNKWGLVSNSNTVNYQDLRVLKRKYSIATGQEWTEYPGVLKAGHVSFHHSLTFHGSSMNNTLKPRLSVVAHLMPKGTKYVPNVQYNPNIRYLGPRPYSGQLFDNEYFPLIFKK